MSAEMSAHGQSAPAKKFAYLYCITQLINELITVDSLAKILADA
jgi:hypothetical protein